jgi:hypothetical protein
MLTLIIDVLFLFDAIMKVRKMHAAKRDAPGKTEFGGPTNRLTLNGDVEQEKETQ